MHHKFLTYGLTFILPGLVWLLWTWRENRRAEAKGKDPRPFGQGPWGWLAIAGAALSLITIVVLENSDQNSLGQKYIPPHYESDGVYVPGRYVDPDAAPDLTRPEKESLPAPESPSQD